MIKADVSVFYRQLDDLTHPHHPHLLLCGYVNAYEKELGYGGPEEGGWWYDSLTPLASIRVFNKRQAVEARELLLDIWGSRFDDDIPVSSVISQGDLLIFVEDEEAQHYPSERPHYE